MDVNTQLQQVLKYVLEGLAVAVVAYYLTGAKTKPREIAMIGVSAALTFFVLDLFAPAVGLGTRQGAGFGIGHSMVGGSPTPMPWEWYNPGTTRQTGGGDFEIGGAEGFETDAQTAEVAEDLGKPWKLKDGMYSAKVLMAGYNENVKPANTVGCPFKAVPSGWGKDVSLDQEGGDGTTAALTADEKKTTPTCGA